MSVNKGQITISKFKTEAEEAAWWDKHFESAAEIMEQALKAGTARRKVPPKTVTMRLPLADLKAVVGELSGSGT